MKENFKDWLADLLREKDLTYEQLGDAIGVSHGAVGGWVRGRYTPDVPSVLQLANFAGEDPYRLLNMVYGIPLPDAEQDADVERLLHKLEAMPEEVRQQAEAYLDFLLQEARKKQNKDIEV